jgi:hypothetical protein
MSSKITAQQTQSKSVTPAPFLILCYRLSASAPAPTFSSTSVPTHPIFDPLHFPLTLSQGLLYYTISYQTSFIVVQKRNLIESGNS